MKKGKLILIKVIMKLYIASTLKLLNSLINLNMKVKFLILYYQDVKYKIIFLLTDSIFLSILYNNILNIFHRPRLFHIFSNFICKSNNGIANNNIGLSNSYKVKEEEHMDKVKVINTKF